MSRTAHATDERAARACGTVKTRMRLCGSPAVPSTTAKAQLAASFLFHHAENLQPRL